MSKVLGVSFGRKMSNTEVMIKEALLKCREGGHVITFIRADDLKIEPCTGCTACVFGLLSGKSNGQCVRQDDFRLLENAFYDADAVIFGSPVYETSPTGTFKMFCDRMGPSHDLAFLMEAKKQRLALGKSGNCLPDERAFKPRVGCLLAVGGAKTKNWTSMAIPVMYECMMSTGVDVIDTHVYYGAMEYDHVLGNQKELKRMEEMAHHILAALEADTPKERGKWRGEEPGACPVCHQNVLEVFPGTRKVECLICGISGTVDCPNGSPVYTFLEEQQVRSRMRYAGKLEHRNEIEEGARTKQRVENLEARLEKYLHIGE